MKHNFKKAASAFVAAAMVLGSVQSAFAGTYVVQKGDYLSKIAPKYKTTWQKLAEMNKLKNPNLIFPNQVLQVPDIEKTAKPVVKTEEPKKEEAKPEVKQKTVQLKKLDVTTMDSKTITPVFSPDVKEYSVTVQSDIYGVLLNAEAEEGAEITVTAAITPAAYGGKDKNEPLVIEKGDNGYIIPLTQTYEGYDSVFVQTATIDVVKGEEKATYTLKITRECDSDIYALFTQDKFRAKDGTEIEYNLYVPSDYDASKKYPVVFVLHGGGQRTQPTDMILKRYQMATVWAKDSEKGHNQCIVLAPQCATKDANENWTTLQKYRNGEADNAFGAMPKLNAAYNLLLKVMDEYSVDKNKVYMTGLSAGGFATYTLAIAHPETFAAIAPDAAGADPTKVSVLKDIPMWIFHAADDPTVKPDEYLYPTLEALDKAGVEYKSTIYKPGTVFGSSAHFSWVPMYATQEFRDWMFAQSK